MHIHSAVFVKSAAGLKDCPEPYLPEYAFIGRSNVGKSSLINRLTGFNKLAKTSSTPGKTRLINHFLINDSWYLTDLPGFGFARVSKSISRTWEQMIRNYLLKRDNLMCVFFLVDIRHEPLANDLGFLEFLGENQLPFYLVFTKTDKLGQNQVQSQKAVYLKKLSETWDPLPPSVITSSQYGTGRNELLDVISKTNLLFNAPGSPISQE